MSETEIIEPVLPDEPEPPARRRRRGWTGLLVLSLIMLGAGIGIGSLIGKTDTNYLTVPGKTVTVTAGPTAPNNPQPSPTLSASVQTVSGSGDSVTAVEAFVPGVTYTLSYTASTPAGSGLISSIIIDQEDDGGGTTNLVNDISQTTTDSGSVLYTPEATAETFQVSNADSETWTLTFTPQAG